MPAEHMPLDFADLQGALHEFWGRVICVEIRRGSGELVADMEGEFGGVHVDAGDPDEVWFEIGGKDPPEREGLRFIVAARAAVHIPEDEFRAARSEFSGIGAFVITIETNVGLQYRVWPAMPPHHQWTEMHDSDR